MSEQTYFVEVVGGLTGEQSDKLADAFATLKAKLEEVTQQRDDCLAGLAKVEIVGLRELKAKLEAKEDYALRMDALAESRLSKLEAAERERDEARMKVASFVDPSLFEVNLRLADDVANLRAKLATSEAKAEVLRNERDAGRLMFAKRLKEFSGERDEAQRAAAVMREALESYEAAHDACGAGSGPEIERIQIALERRFDEIRKAALASDAGRGYLCPEDVEKVRVLVAKGVRSGEGENTNCHARDELEEIGAILEKAK